MGTHKLGVVAAGGESKAKRRRRTRDPANKCLDGQGFCIKCKKPRIILGFTVYDAEFVYKKTLGVEGKTPRMGRRRRMKGTCACCAKALSRLICGSGSKKEASSAPPLSQASDALPTETQTQKKDDGECCDGFFSEN